MHILFLTDNFPPEANAPAIRTYEHCVKWISLGSQVTVITCAPNFPEGKIFPGYKNSFWQISIVDGIRVIRVWSYMAPNKGFVLRSLDHFSFAVISFLVSFFVRNVDIIVGTSPQFFTVCSAFLISKVRRTPWIFEVRDLWPESIVSVGVLKPGLTVKVIQKVADCLYRKSAHIVVVTKSFKHYLIKRSIDPKKITTILNGVNLKNFRVGSSAIPARKRSKRWPEKLVVGYVGTVGSAHGLEIVLNLCEKLLRTKGGERFRFKIIGNGANYQQLEHIALERNLSNLEFPGPVNRSEISRVWSEIDIGLVHLVDDPLFRYVIPSKIFEAMATATPLLLGVEGEAAKLVRRHRVGLVFKSGCLDDLFEKLMALCQDREAYQSMAINGRNASKIYDREILASKMHVVLQKIAKPRLHTRISSEGRNGEK